MIEEIWKDIKGYVGLYQISNLGRVKSLKRITVDGKTIKERILKPGTDKPGYEFIILRKNNKSHNLMIHRLVAEAFIENPNKYSCVNHKDGNKLNNNVSNLEWCTYSYNLKHAILIGKVKNQCKITRKVTVKYDEKIVVFETMSDCCKFFGYKKGWLHNQIRKHGCKFNYGKYIIEVHERGVV